MIDPIMENLKEQQRQLERKLGKWLELKEEFLPLVQELVLLGCDVNMNDGDLNVIFAGDKQKFLAVVRSQYKHGLRPDLSRLKKGDTGGSWFAEKAELRIYTSFSSTVCRRVQTGTKLAEVPIYETVCESMIPEIGEIKALEAENEKIEVDIPF